MHTTKRPVMSSGGLPKDILNLPENIQKFLKNNHGSTGVLVDAAKSATSNAILKDILAKINDKIDEMLIHPGNLIDEELKTGPKTKNASMSMTSAKKSQKIVIPMLSQLD